MKTIKIMGHEVGVLPTEQCENFEHVVCCRVGQLSPESAAKMAVHQLDGAHCFKCQHPVHRDKRGPLKPPSICMECLLDETNGVRSVAE